MGVIQHGIYRPFPGEPSVPHPQELATNEEPREEKPMGKSPGTCIVKDCGKKAVARGLCPKHYMAERDRLKKEGTWNPIPQVGLSKPKPETTGTDPEPAQKAIPQAETPATETTGPGPEAPPLPGDLYLVAKIPLEQIRVMTEEQLREMFGG